MCKPYALPKTEPVGDALQSTVPQLIDDDDETTEKKISRHFLTGRIERNKV